jgi:HEAT repeat protein
MGTGSSSKRPTRRVRNSITNYELKIKNFRACFRAFVFLCVFCVLCVKISFSQTIENLAEQIGAGNSEQKRSVLFEIRNRQSEIYSRIAVPALKDSDEIVRATAAFSVIYLPKDEAFNALIPNLQDKSEIVRRETAYALGKVQNSLAINPLILAFQKDKSTEVKNACIIALGEIGDASAIDALTPVLRQKPSDDNNFLRRSAARSIGQIAQIIQIQKSQVITPQNFLPDKYKEIKLPKYLQLTDEFPVFRESIIVLIQTLQNSKESGDVKREAAFGLGAIGDKAAISVLQKNLINQDYYLAEICKEALRRISA